MAEALPPSVTGIPPAGFSPVPMDSGNPGDVAQGLGFVREAVKILQQALMKFPIGSDPHKSVTEMISKGSKIAPAAEAAPGVQNTVQRNLANQASGQASYIDVMKSLAGTEGAGAGAPTPPAAAATPPPMA